MDEQKIAIDIKDVEALINADPVVSLKLMNTTLSRLLSERDVEISVLKERITSLSQGNGSDSGPSGLEATVEAMPSTSS